MRIIVKVKPKAREEKVVRVGQSTLGFGGDEPDTPTYRVWVKEPPVDGRANEAVVKALARYFEVTLSQIRLVHGQTSKQKVFDVDVAE